MNPLPHEAQPLHPALHPGLHRQYGPPSAISDAVPDSLPHLLPSPPFSGSAVRAGADDLDGRWGSPGGITSGDLAAVAAMHVPELLALATALTGDARRAGEVVAVVLAGLPGGWAADAATPRPDLRLRRLVLREVRRPRWSGRRGVPTSALNDLPRTPAPSRDAVGLALVALPHRHKMVLVLRYHQHLDDAEVAAVVGRRPAVVRARTARALAALRATAPDAPNPVPLPEETP